ncbi:MAG: M42 family peptidase [Clostridia bacterium]|nr:M42 family peptidase [Clostridia bacterium]
MLNTVKTLCALSGVSSFEDEVRDYIRGRAAAHAYSSHVDAMGNLIVFKKGFISSGNRLMLCAHMDEVGLMVRHVTDEGYLKFDTVGGIDRRVLIGKRVLLGKMRIPGVIGLKAYHLVSSDEEKKLPKLEELYIDIGAKDKESAQRQVSVGEDAVFDGETVEFGDGMLKAKAIDDRIGCAVMVKLLEEDLPMDCVFAFTVQEEVGTRGAKIAAARVKPDIAIVLEGTTAADLPEVPEGKRICRLGDGIVIPFMDRGAIYSRKLFKTVTELADRNEIKWQTKTMIAGGTDAQAVQRSGAGVETIALSAPIRNIHSPASIAKISDFEIMPRLVTLLLETLCEE